MIISIGPNTNGCAMTRGTYLVFAAEDEVFFFKDELLGVESRCFGLCADILPAPALKGLI